MVDDVQAKYSDEVFWTFFQKSVLPRLTKPVLVLPFILTAKKRKPVLTLALLRHQTKANMKLLSWLSILEQSLGTGAAPFMFTETLNSSSMPFKEATIPTSTNSSHTTSASLKPSYLYQPSSPLQTQDLFLLHPPRLQQESVMSLSTLNSASISELAAGIARYEYDPSRSTITPTPLSTLENTASSILSPSHPKDFLPYFPIPLLSPLPIPPTSCHNPLTPSLIP